MNTANLWSRIGYLQTIIKFKSLFENKLKNFFYIDHFSIHFQQVAGKTAKLNMLNVNSISFNTKFVMATPMSHPKLPSANNEIIFDNKLDVRLKKSTLNHNPFKTTKYQNLMWNVIICLFDISIALTACKKSSK